MLIVREVFIAKPGMASKLAKMMKESWADEKTRILTDMTGVYNKVVMEFEVEDLATWEKMMKEYMTKGNDTMKGYTEMYSQGKREIFRVW